MPIPSNGTGNEGRIKQKKKTTISSDRKCKSLLNVLYTFYHTSALKRANLKAMFIASDTSPVFPKCVGGTRWTDHTFRALKNLEQGYTTIIIHLEEKTKQQCLILNESRRVVALGILRKMTNILIMKHSMKLLEVLSIFLKLSKAFQDRKMPIANVQDGISSTMMEHNCQQGQLFH